MRDFLLQYWHQLVGRVGGPLTFRFVIQPIVALLLAIRDGRRDALKNRVPYFWAIFTESGHRVELLKEGWKAVVRVFIIGVIVDVIYQIIEFHWIYPLQSLVVAFVLAFVPYLLLRGPINRIWRMRL